MSLGHLSRCRQSATFCVRIAAVIAGVLVASTWGGSASAHDREVGLTTADQLIDEAGRAKSGGQPATCVRAAAPGRATSLPIIRWHGGNWAR